MEIRVQIDGIDGAIAALGNAITPADIQRGLLAAALVIEGSAKMHVTRIDTGFMRNSIWSATAGVGNYNQAYSAAKQSNPLATMLPEDKPGRLEAIIAVGAEYGIYHEMGTKYMSSAPFMRPALEANQGQIGRIISDAIAHGRRRT